MDLRSGDFLWPEAGTDAHGWPALLADAQCDVAVIGGGITGALVGWHLIRRGVNVLLLDRRTPGRGSTIANTGLLQYELDVSLLELAARYGLDAAAHAYHLCHEALQWFDELVMQLPDKCGLAQRPSLYLASMRDDLEMLAEEARTRRRIGIDVQLLAGSEMAGLPGSDRPAALWSTEAREVDPYRLCQMLLQEAHRLGMGIHAGVDLLDYQPDEAGVTLLVRPPEKGSPPLRVRARRVVFATGYETPAFLDPSLCRLQSTYAIASAPITPFPEWPQRCLVWETARPYLYARTTPDGRIVLGGGDEGFSDPYARDALIAAKARWLRTCAGELFPALSMQTAHAWAGTFAETADGLPYIGTHADYPWAWFALGCGGNGTTFALIAARLITDLFFGTNRNQALQLYRFNRF